VLQAATRRRGPGNVAALVDRVREDVGAPESAQGGHDAPAVPKRLIHEERRFEDESVAPAL
jgi:hypothetical protein